MICAYALENSLCIISCESEGHDASQVWLQCWIALCLGDAPLCKLVEVMEREAQRWTYTINSTNGSVGSNSNGFLWWGSSKLWLATLVAGGALDEVLVAMLLGWAFQLEGVAGGVFLRAQWLGWTAVWTIGRGGERVWANLSSLGFECDSNCNNERVLYIYY